MAYEFVMNIAVIIPTVAVVGAAAVVAAVALTGKQKRNATSQGRALFDHCEGRRILVCVPFQWHF